MDSLKQIMENRRRARQIYLQNLADNPKKTLDSVRQAELERHTASGQEQLEWLKTNQRLDTLKEIDLSYAGLDRVPPFVCQASNIEKLVLDYNNIKKLPAELGHLEHLKSISWNNNALEDYWWIRIQRIPQIETLDLGDNTLTRVPHGVKKLKGLKHLILDQNLFEEIAVNRLSRIDSLEKLSLNRNHLLEIKEGPYHKLSFLKELYLNRCNIESLDPSFYQLSGL